MSVSWGKRLTQLEVACGLLVSPAAHGVLSWSWSSAACDQTFDFRPLFTAVTPSFTPQSPSTWQIIHGGSRPMMLHWDSSCQVHMRLRRCTAAASAVDTDSMPHVCVAGGAMFDATSACDSRRVRMPTCALMHTADHVPTACCSPVLQMPAEHRPRTTARSTGGV